MLERPRVIIIAGAWALYDNSGPVPDLIQWSERA